MPSSTTSAITTRWSSGRSSKARATSRTSSWRWKLTRPSSPVRLLLLQRLGAAAMRAQLVAPQVLRDAEQPAVEPGAGLPGGGMHQRPLDGRLRQVVRIGVGTGQRTGEAPQARQQFHQLLRENQVIGARGSQEEQRPAAAEYSRSRIVLVPWPP